MTDLASLLADVEQGHFPPADAGLTLVPPSCPRHAAVLAFTAHIVVVADVDLPWIRTLLAPGELGEAFTPPFLGALAEKLDRRINAIDMLVLAPPGEGTTDVSLSAVESEHPRVRRARRYRDDVRVWAAEGGVVVLGRGLGGRWEVAVEVDDQHRNRGLGRRFAAAARGLVPGERSLWAQITPGNAASVRAFLAAGYAPVGMEALLVSR